MRTYLKLIFFSALLIIFAYIALNIYIVNSISGIPESIVENRRQRQESRENRLNNYQLYGDGVREIDEEEYILSREYDKDDSTCVNSKVVKIDSVITVNNYLVELSFIDKFDPECMACVREYEVICEIRDKNLLIIETSNYRTHYYQVVNIKSGVVDTVNSYPIFTIWHDYFITNNEISRDTIVSGISLWKVNSGRVNRIFQIGKNWIPIDYYWRSPEFVFTKAYLVKNNMIDYDNPIYLEVNLKAYIDEAIINGVKVHL